MKLVKMSIAAVVTALLAGCSGSMVVPGIRNTPPPFSSNADQAKGPLPGQQRRLRVHNEFNYVVSPRGYALDPDAQASSHQFDEGMSYFCRSSSASHFTGNLAGAEALKPSIPSTLAT